MHDRMSEARLAQIRAKINGGNYYPPVVAQLVAELDAVTRERDEAWEEIQAQQMAQDEAMWKNAREMSDAMFPPIIDGLAND